MLTADCQNSRGKGKTLGLHSTVFSESNGENTPLNNKNQDKKAEKRPQLRKSGWPFCGDFGGLIGVRATESMGLRV
jgi:hypothetical protein